MTTNYHTALADGDGITIAEIEERLDDLDGAIDTRVAAAVTVTAAIVKDVKATTTDGGGASATTWNQRDLNTEVDPDNLVAISSNNFTPVSGTYLIIARAPAVNVDAHRLRLYNVTQTSEVHLGMVMQAGTNGNHASLKYIFSANGTDAYRIDHYTQSAQATNGLGRAVDDGADEVYCHVVLVKIG